MLYPSDLEAEQIFQRKMELLRSQTVTTAAGNSIAALVVAALMWSTLANSALIIWSMSVIAIVHWRLLKVNDYRKYGDPSQLAACFRFCARSVTVNGAVWGLMFAYLSYHIEPRNMIYPFMALGAITAGTSLLYNGHFNPFRYFGVPALLMPSTVLIVAGSTEKMWVGVTLLCWFLLMHSISSQLSRFLAKSTRYETENIVLIRDLEYQREYSKRLNEELQLKSQIIEQLCAKKGNRVSSIRPKESDRIA
ncbi:MAG: hypothetical protein AAF542_00755 [Pseudomonadota bacterium]